MKFVTLLCLLSYSCFAYEVTKLSFSGDTDLDLSVQGNEVPEEIPKLKVEDNKIEFTLKDATLDPEMHGKSVINSPHALIEKAEFTEEKEGVVGRLWVNGTARRLDERAAAKVSGGNLHIKVTSPNGGSPTLDLLRDEQKPFSLKEIATKGKDSFSPRYFGSLLLVLGLAVLTSFGVVRLLKKKGINVGKKYLIEQVAYHPLGTRSGVALLKVGNEFILVGVTPTNIRMISNLPMLSAQYQDEVKFERGHFEDAVQDEIDRLKKEIAL